MKRFFARLGLKALFDRFARNKYEQEFLPAALEVLETPASPLGRTFGFTVVLIFAVALIWAFIGNVDVDAVAQGKLVPVGGSKALQPFESSIVRKINVEEGQHVEAGQVLVELDSTENQVDLSQLQRQQELAELDVKRLTTFLEAVREGHRKVSWQDASQSFQSVNSQVRLNERLAMYWSKRESMMAQIDEATAIMEESRNEQEKLSQRLPLSTERASAWKKLLDQRMASRLQWLEAENDRIDVKKNLEIERRKSDQTHATIRRQEADLSQFQYETLQQAVAELTEAADKQKEATLNILRYRERQTYRTLRAPIAGTVQQLAVHTRGGVVQPAQVLMVIAPDNAKLSVEAKVLNQDIGFVQKDQEVTLKIDSYPYTKYGTVKARVTTVSRDSVPDEKLGSVYIARIDLIGDTRTKMGVNLPLRAGMSVVAEIKTDNRRVIDYLLSPIKEVFSEAIRER